MDIKQEITKIENLFKLISNINQTIVEEGKISHLEKELIKDYLKKVLLKYQEIAELSGVATKDANHEQITDKNIEKISVVESKKEEWQDLKSEFNKTIDEKYAPFTHIKVEEPNVIEAPKVNEVVKEVQIVENITTAADDLLATVEASKIKDQIENKIEEVKNVDVEVPRKAIEFLEDEDNIADIIEKAKVIAKTEEKKNTIINDDDEYKPTMNDLFKEKISKAKDLNSTKAKSLKDSLMLNERIAFTKELFGGNAEEFAVAIANIDKSATVAEAFGYLESAIVNKNNWAEKEKMANQFYELIKQKFGVN